MVVDKIKFNTGYCGFLPIFVLASSISMLYLVPTPIGNLEDMTIRALRILKECDVILTEDTRTSGKLLAHFGIEKPMWSFHAFNEHKALAGILAHLQSGKTIALVTDAGTPGISDPGFLLVRACRDQGVPVCPLPGPTAFVPALVGSGLPADKFYFEGFLPHKKGRQTRWKFLSTLDVTIILYESPHRLDKCLSEIQTFLGPDRKVCVAREISKTFEEFIILPAEEAIHHFSKTPVRGELVLVIEGSHRGRSHADTEE
jgi:16S rRNA (cytidine1402-2'-O)-methyltransferase